MDSAADETWEEVQKTTFCKWISAQLPGEVPVENLFSYFEDGVQLIKLIRSLYPALPVPRFTPEPSLRVQKLDNLISALKLLDNAGISVPFLKATDLVDGNKKMIMGLIWTLIAECSIKGSLVKQEDTQRQRDIQRDPTAAASGSAPSRKFRSFEDAKAALLLWCQKQVRSYEGVKIENFSTSFHDGRALAALVHAMGQDLFGMMEFDTLTQLDKKEMLDTVFDVANREMHVFPLLDAQDFLAEPPHVDERSIMTYISELLKYWNSEEKLMKDLDREFSKARMSEPDAAEQQARSAQMSQQKPPYSDWPEEKPEDHYQPLRPPATAEEKAIAAGITLFPSSENQNRGARDDEPIYPVVTHTQPLQSSPSLSSSPQQSSQQQQPPSGARTRTPPPEGAAATPLGSSPSISLPDLSSPPPVQTKPNQYIASPVLQSRGPPPFQQHQQQQPPRQSHHHQPQGQRHMYPQQPYPQQPYPQQGYPQQGYPQQPYPYRAQATPYATPYAQPLGYPMAPQPYMSNVSIPAPYMAPGGYLPPGINSVMYAPPVAPKLQYYAPAPAPMLHHNSIPNLVQAQAPKAAPAAQPPGKGPVSSKPADEKKEKAAKEKQEKKDKKEKKEKNKGNKKYQELEEDSSQSPPTMLRQQSSPAALSVPGSAPSQAQFQGPPLPPGWTVHMDGQGKPFFKHPATGTVTYTHPSALLASPTASQPASPPASSATGSNSEAPLPPPDQLPPGWEVKWDPSSSRFFYIDHNTKQTTFSPPPRA